MNINKIEKKLNNIQSKPKNKKYLLNIINGNHDLEVLTLFDEPHNSLVDFICAFKSEITEQGLQNILSIQDIINPALDDSQSYEATKHQLISDSDEELSMGDFPKSIDDLISLQSTKVYGFHSGHTHYMYSLNELHNLAVQNKQH
jgi:hypothetical protein